MSTNGKVSLRRWRESGSNSYLGFKIISICFDSFVQDFFKIFPVHSRIRIGRVIVTPKGLFHIGDVVVQQHKHMLNVASICVDEKHIPELGEDFKSSKLPDTDLKAATTAVLLV